MNNITYAVSVDVNNPIIPYNVYVASVLDSNVRYLEITLYQNGNVIALSNEATATASLVTDDVLIDDSVECTISNNIITVPLEDLQRHGNLDVQVTVAEGEKVLAIPFPIQVRVTPNIAEEAQIDENSMGSYAEVVQEIAEARNGYDSLDERLNSDASGMEAVMHKVQSIGSQSQTGDNDKYPSASAVRNYVKYRKYKTLLYRLFNTVVLLLLTAGAGYLLRKAQGCDCIPLKWGAAAFYYLIVLVFAGWLFSILSFMLRKAVVGVVCFAILFVFLAMITLESVDKDKR